MLPWADEKYMSATPADISVYLRLVRDANFRSRYPTLEISGEASLQNQALPQSPVRPGRLLRPSLGFPSQIWGRGLVGTGAGFSQQNGDDLFSQDQV